MAQAGQITVRIADGDGTKVTINPNGLATVGDLQRAIREYKVCAATADQRLMFNGQWLTETVPLAEAGIGAGSTVQLFYGAGPATDPETKLGELRSMLVSAVEAGLEAKRVESDTIIRKFQADVIGAYAEAVALNADAALKFEVKLPSGQKRPKAQLEEAVALARQHPEFAGMQMRYLFDQPGNTTTATITWGNADEFFRKEAAGKPMAQLQLAAFGSGRKVAGAEECLATQGVRDQLLVISLACVHARLMKFAQWHQTARAKVAQVAPPTPELPNELKYCTNRHVVSYPGKCRHGCTLSLALCRCGVQLAIGGQARCTRAGSMFGTCGIKVPNASSTPATKDDGQLRMALPPGVTGGKAFEKTVLAPWLRAQGITIEERDAGRSRVLAFGGRSRDAFQRPARASATHESHALPYGIASQPSQPEPAA